MVPRLAMTFLLGVMCAAIAHAERGSESEVSRDSGVAPDVLVRRVHLPVLIEPLKGLKRLKGAATGECATLAPEQIELREDGVPVRVSAHGPRPSERLHALLIDTSRSMLPNIDEAKAAALDYLDSLPAGDRALVASFDESMTLQTAATTDREQLRDGVKRLEIGYATALWDAMYSLMHYLEPQPGEHVIILITDGEDSGSLAGRTESVYEQAASTSDTIVFAIGLDLPASVGRGFPMARGRLGELARLTGGAFFETRSASGLTATFNRVQDQLARRSYVSYIPLPFGEGPRDRVETATFRERKVRVRAREGVPCKIVPLGPPKRIEGRPEPAATRVAALTPEEGQRVLSSMSFATCSAPPFRALSHKLELHGDTPATLYTTASGEAVLGTGTDFALERGPLFVAGTAKPTAKVSLDRKPVFVTRDFAMATPPLGAVRERLNRPVDLLLYMLEQEYCAPETHRKQQLARGPYFVHGETFLKLRSLLGQALFTGYPDYRAWSLARTESVVDSQVQRLRTGSTAGRALGTEAVQSLRTALMARESELTEGSASTLLAAWLGDVEAVEIARDLEVEIANTLLAAQPEPAAGDAPGVADLVFESWDKLGRWFPPATHARIVVPLIPVYDPAADVIGFYRFVLPRPNLVGRPVETISERPLGLVTLRWMLDRPEIAELVEGRLELRSLDYDRVRRSELAGLDCQTPRPTRKVRLQLGRPGLLESLTLSAYYRDDPQAEPACFAIETADHAPADWRDAIRRLDQALSRTSRTTVRAGRGR